MTPNRRARVILLSVFGAVFLILYLTADARRVQNQRFYQQTVEAMDAKAASKHAGDDEILFQKLKPPTTKPEDEQAVAAERQTRESPIRKEDDGEKSIAGRKKMPVSNPEQDTPPEPKKEEDPEVERELNSILKRSPIIIFSKSYCPYSRKAKTILLDQYNIVPAPYVVELDLHPVGPKLQHFLAGNTGRSTVPNILVNGRSIGGGDEIQALHESGELASKIKSMAGKRVMEVKVKTEKML